MRRPNRRPSRHARRLLIAAACVVVLGLVFVAYLQPDQTLALATRLWACF